MAARLASIVSAASTENWRQATQAPLLSTPSLSNSSSVSPPGPFKSGSLRPNGFEETLPTSVSVDINTPEDLAAVNAFLLALGRDVTSLPRSPPQVIHPLLQPRGSTEFIPHENWFNDDALAHIGLIGLPGLPTPLLSMQDPEGTYLSDFPTSRPFNPHGRHQSQASDTGGLYPTLDGGLSRLSARDSTPDTRYQSLGSHYFSPTPPPPANSASPRSTGSSAGSSLGAPTNHQRTSGQPSPYEGGIPYPPRVDVGSYDTSQLKLSFDSLKAPSPISPLQHTPALAARRGAGILDIGIKEAPRLQTSIARLRAKSKEHGSHATVTEEDNIGDEENDENTPVEQDQLNEKASDVDMTEGNHEGFRASSPEAMEGSRMSDSDSPDSDAGVHKPGHTLYPLLHQKGDPSLKLPALTLPSRRQSSTTVVESPRSSSSIYPTLASLTSASPATAPSTPSQRRTTLPPIASVVVTAPVTPSSELSIGVRNIGLSEGARSMEPTSAYRLKPKVPYAERIRHASLIKALLIQINTEYVKKYGVSGPPRQYAAPRSRTPLEDAMELDSPVGHVRSAA
jgi:hypothetical protein